MRWILSILMPWLFCPAWADSPHPAEHASEAEMRHYSPRPYRATYLVRRGKRKVKMRVQLQEIRDTDVAPGTFWRYDATAKILFWTLAIRSRLRRSGDLYQPLSAEAGFGKKIQSYQFDWEEGELIWKDPKGRKLSADLDIRMRDNVAVQMEIAAGLADEGFKEADWLIAESGDEMKIRPLNLLYAGREKLSTQLGELQTERVESKDGKRIFWFAPTLNWLLVRTLRADKEEEWQLLQVQFKDEAE